MNKRKYSIAEGALKHNQFWSSQKQNSSSSESKSSDCSVDTDLASSKGTVESKPSVPEELQDIVTVSPKPRQAYPVSKTQQPITQGPALRPKNTPKRLPNPSEPQTIKAPHHQSNKTNRTEVQKRQVESKPKPFEDRYERITTYLEKPLFHRVHELHKRGEIAKIASLLNAALRDYLIAHYPGK